MTDQSSRTKTRQKEPYSVFTSAQGSLGLEAGELCHQLGFDRTAWSGWKVRGEMPAVAARLCKAMVAAPGRTGTRTMVIVVCKGPAEIDAVRALARGLDCETTTVTL